MALALLGIAAACAPAEGRWTTPENPPEIPHALQAGRYPCDETAPERHVPDPAPPLTESEALHYIARTLHGSRCVSVAERARIARDTGALRLYAAILDGRRSAWYPDSGQALLWLALSDDPAPYLPTLLAYGEVDSSRAGVEGLWQFTVDGLLRLAPHSATARDRLTAIARQGGLWQRWQLAHLLVRVNDSMARTILRENADALAAGQPVRSRFGRDLAAVLRAPPPPPEAQGPCRDGRRPGRTASGAYGCVRVVPGAITIHGGKFRRVAEFHRPAPRGRAEGPGISINVLGTTFLGGYSFVSISAHDVGPNASGFADAAPEALLSALLTPAGELRSASSIADSLVVAARDGGTVLTIPRRSRSMTRPYDLVMGTTIPPSPPERRTIALSPNETDALLRALRDAANVARALDSAGVEETMPLRD